jgi:hypothetical protein
MAIKPCDVFGRLRVLRRGRSNSKHVWWLCRCLCPKQTIKEVRADSLRCGAIRSCGCLHRDISSASGNHFTPGTRFGRLTVIKEVIQKRKGYRWYLCKCDCGKRATVSNAGLVSGSTKSCGCLYRETRKTAGFKHGKCPVRKKFPEYSAYHRQRSLCRNPKTKWYEYYGGRGIEFRFDSFPEFYACVGDKPSADHWLMRIDPDGHFEAENLEWVVRRKKRAKKIRQPEFRVAH